MLAELKRDIERGRKMASREARKRAQAKYDAKHRQDYYCFYVKLKKAEAGEMINFLKSKENMSAYIRDLISKDMASGN